MPQEDCQEFCKNLFRTEYKHLAEFRNMTDGDARRNIFGIISGVRLLINAFGEVRMGGAESLEEIHDQCLKLLTSEWARTMAQQCMELTAQELEVKRGRPLHTIIVNARQILEFYLPQENSEESSESPGEPDVWKQFMRLCTDTLLQEMMPITGLDPDKLHAYLGTSEGHVHVETCWKKTAKIINPVNCVPLYRVIAYAHDRIDGIADLGDDE